MCLAVAKSTCLPLAVPGCPGLIHTGYLPAGVLAQQYQGQYYGGPGLAAADYAQQAQRQGQVGGGGPDDLQQQHALLQEQQRQRQLAAVLGFEQAR